MLLKQNHYTRDKAVAITSVNATSPTTISDIKKRKKYSCIKRDRVCLDEALQWKFILVRHRREREGMRIPTPPGWKWEWCPKDLLREGTVGEIVLRHTLDPPAAMVGAYPRRKCVLFSPGKAMTACLRDYVSWGQMKSCMEVTSCMRSQRCCSWHWQSSEVCWGRSLFLGSHSWVRSGWPQFRLSQSYS